MRYKNNDEVIELYPLLNLHLMEIINEALDSQFIYEFSDVTKEYERIHGASYAEQEEIREELLGKFHSEGTDAILRKYFVMDDEEEFIQLRHYIQRLVRNDIMDSCIDKSVMELVIIEETNKALINFDVENFIERALI